MPKRGGVGQRLLEIPKPRLLRLQRKLLDDVVSAIPTHSAAHGFVRGRSLLGHVRPHCGQEVVVTLDLQSWFWHVGFARIYGLFRRGGLSRPVARTLAGLAVTSTALDVLHDRPGTNAGALGLECMRRGGGWDEVGGHGHGVATVLCGSVLQKVTGGAFPAAHPTQERLLERAMERDLGPIALHLCDVIEGRGGRLAKELEMRVAEARRRFG